MATIGSNYHTLADLAVSDGDKVLVEILNQKNGMTEDAPWVECNDGSGHKGKIRTGLPTPTWRLLYAGVDPTRGSFAQIRDACGNLEDYSECDKMEYELAGDNRETWRMWEDAAHIEGIGQTLASTVIYGNVGTSPEKFHGLAPRYNALTGSTSDNVISALGASTDNTSIWAIGWGPQSCHMIYPKGMKPGLQFKDLGEQTRQDTNALYQVMRSHYQITPGLHLKDWRTVGRICNIALSTHRGTEATQKLLVKYLIQLSERIERPIGGRTILYANKMVTAALRLGILEKIANNLTFETVEGKRVMMFDDMEIKRCDALLQTEATIT